MAFYFITAPTIQLTIEPLAPSFTLIAPTILTGIATARSIQAIGSLLMDFPVNSESVVKKPVTEPSVNMTMETTGSAEVESPVTETGPTSTLMKLTGEA